MTDAASVNFLQLCPNDHPPFLDICEVHAAAAEQVGLSARTVFLGPARAQPMAKAVYLDQADMRSTRRLGGALAAALGDVAEHPLDLALCHRYRALEAFRRSGLSAQRTVCVAHEFGFFRRARRRLRRALMYRRVQFAGISAPVVAELETVVGNALLLPNGIDLARQARDRLSAAQAQQALDLQAEDFNVAVVGRLHPKKQPQLALAGFCAFAVGRPGATLTFLGDGELRRDLQDAAADQRVNFAGFVAHAARYLSAFDAVLIPSGEQEAFNMVALEAMAAGVPVVAGPAPGPRYVLGDVGIYFSAAAPAAVAGALEVAYARAPASEASAERGRARAEAEFSLAAASKRLRSYLDSGPLAAPSS